MALQAGHLFGNYRIVRLLGEGGFGEVYLAENPLIERRAAVKLLHTSIRSICMNRTTGTGTIRSRSKWRRARRLTPS